MVISVALVALLALWLALTVLNQFSGNRLTLWVRRHDLFGIVPFWTFFAPNPGILDFNLVYRDEAVDGALSPWREIDQLYLRPYRVLWNPEKRTRKAVTDISQTIYAEMARIAERDLVNVHRRLMLEVSYLLLLNYVEAQPRSPLIVARQFALAVTDGHRRQEDPIVTLTSPFHRVD